MSELDWVHNYGFLGIRLFDLPSFLICTLLVILLGYRYKVPSNYQVILFLHCLLPFVINYVLFDPSYMPDQFRYLQGVYDIRNGNINMVDALTDPGNVLQASAMLSIIPLPSPVSVISLGFYNTFLYIILFFIIYNKKIFTPISLLIYLLFPTLALYSALALRDTLIFFFMILTVIYARESKPLKSSLCTVPLLLIKFQNFFILTPIVLLYFIFKVAKRGMTLSKALIIALISFISLLAAAPIAIPMINFFRGAMYREDGGEGSIDMISGVNDFIIEGLSSGVYFLVKPLLWEAKGALPFIQSFENTIILFILFLITYQAWTKNLNRLAFWLLFLVFSMSIYGLVVFNYGTAARYRYSFIMIYTLFVCADCNIQKLFPKKRALS